MLKYTVRNLAEGGGGWQGYRESFRALRSMEGWSWDSVSYELWLSTAQQPQFSVAPQGGPTFSTRVPLTNPPATVMRTTWVSSAAVTPATSDTSADGMRVATLRLEGRNCKHENPLFPSAICTNNDRVIPSPVSPAALSEVLQVYDVVRSQYLVNGFRAGFETGCLGVPVQKGKGVKNMRSTFEFPQVTDFKLKKELALGRIVGPFDVPPTNPAYRISPLGVIPKKTPGEF